MEFLSPELIENPYPHYQFWRDEHPIWRDEKSNSWILSRYDDVRSILKNSATYSSQAMGQRGETPPLPLLTDDAPRHTKLRGIVDRAFTVRMLKSMEGRVAEIAERLIRDLPGGEAVDIVQALTIPLPVAVISEMMGIPPDKGDDFKRWSDALTGTLSSGSIGDHMEDVMEMGAYFKSLIPERRERPGPDLVSAVVNAEVDGERLSDEDIVGFNILLLIAGNETTTNLLGNLFNVFLDTPDLYRELAAQPKLIDNAIEEILRYDSPVQFLMRTATKPMHYHGVAVAEGDVVTIITGSANRDDREYENANTFSLHRAKNRHHSFGFGIHFCMGAPLARMEAKLVLKPLLDRFSSMSHASGENERVPSALLRGFHHLWVKLEE